MKVYHTVFRADSVTYMVAKALSCAGYNVTVCVSDPEHGQEPPSKVTSRLMNVPRVLLIEAHEVQPSDEIDRLIIQMFPRPNVMLADQALKTLAAKAKKVVLITAGDRSRYWRTAYRMQWEEIRTFKKLLPRIERIMYKDGLHKFDLFTLFKPRRNLGFDIHSMFLDDDDAFNYIQKQNWSIEENRSTLINFMGSQDPKRRKDALDSIRHLLDQSTKKRAQSPGKKILWHEYSDAQPAALGLSEFVDILTSSDFTLCPPGYSLITHRVIEALLRGSIPILHEDELDLYDINLANGINCIAVSPEQWDVAADRCFNMSHEAIISMRHNIRTLVQEQLLYPISSRHMRRRLGLDT